MTYEFYSPFFHIPGRYEWCTIHAEQYGSFSCFIVIHSTTEAPVTLYLAADNGLRFMKERFPESTVIQVAEDALQIEMITTTDARGSLAASEGPVRNAHMEFSVSDSASAIASTYGAPDFAVWGSRFSCEGVDLELGATVTGSLTRADGTQERFDGTDGVLTLGSFGRLQERADLQQGR
jgi:hypothetical protein